MNWKKHPPTCTCGKCEKDRASRARQQEVAVAKMTGQPVPPAPEKQKRVPNDTYLGTLYGSPVYASSAQPDPTYSTYAQQSQLASRARQAAAAWPTIHFQSTGALNYYGYMNLGSSSGYYDQAIQQAIKNQLAQRMGYTLSVAEYETWPDTPTPDPVTIDSIPEETDLVRGWRTYVIDAQGRLKGSRAVWETAEFVAKCEVGNHTTPAETAVSHLLNRCFNNLAMGCGIYSHKVGPEYLSTDRLTCDHALNSPAESINVVAQCISSGVVVEHEHGYRAEKCRIEQMWLVTPRRCANGHWVKMEGGQAHQPTEIKWRRETDSTGRDWMVTDYGPGIPAGVMDDPVAYWNTQAQIEADIRARNMTTPPRWTCSETPVENPGAAYAQVLSTKYGVPCIAMPTAEFIAKLDEGSL